MQQLYLSTQEYGAQAGRATPSAQDFVAACDEMGIAPKMLKPNRHFERTAPLKNPASVDVTAARRKRKNRRRKRACESSVTLRLPSSHRVALVNARHANLIPRDLSSPEPELLPSEEYPHVPTTLRNLQPAHSMHPYHHQHQKTSSSASATFPPAYPPKHTYIRSPPSPPQRSSLTASLDKRMQNTAKVRAALKNMMDAADIHREDVTGEGSQGADGKPAGLRYHLTNSSLVNWQETFTTTRRRWKVAK
jgi:transcription initiation factor TFIID subunit 8